MRTIIPLLSLSHKYETTIKKLIILALHNDEWQEERASLALSTGNSKSHTISGIWWNQRVFLN